jgi:signal transduction histidine kinase/CheY-like chemotaxis protein
LAADEPAKTPLFKSSRQIHRRHRKKSGEIMDMELTSASLDFEGRPAILVAANNITERLKAEAQVRHNERLDAIGSLTGGIAHDFNNLLTVIKASAEDLRDTLTDPALKQSAELALEAANRGADLIQHLMAFARKQDLSPALVDVNVLTYNVIRLMRRTLPTNIGIRFEAGGDLPSIQMDPSRLENAILNLAVNARDAMPDGGELLIETAITTLDEEYATANTGVQADTYLMIALSDTGAGMAQDVIDHAFEPFFTTKGVGKGTGLGLSMAYGLMKQIGGHAKIYSVLGKGTTVKLYMPLASETAHEQKKEIPEKTVLPDERGAVLLVEDDDLVRKSLTTKLQRLGYAVRAVSSAGEAIDTLERESHFQVMLSDVMMPGAMNGGELAHEVVKRWPHIGVLLNSGYTENSIGGKAKIPDGIRVLSKPYSNADLVNALQEARLRRS